MKTFKFLLTIVLLTLSLNTSAQYYGYNRPPVSSKRMQEYQESYLKKSLDSLHKIYNESRFELSEQTASVIEDHLRIDRSITWPRVSKAERKNIEDQYLQGDNECFKRIAKDKEAFKLNEIRKAKEELSRNEEDSTRIAKLAEEKVIEDYENRKIPYGEKVDVLVLDKALIFELPDRKYYEAEFKFEYTENSKIYNKKTKKYEERQTTKNDIIKVYSFPEDIPSTLILLWELQENLIRKIANGDVYEVTFKSMRGDVSCGSTRDLEGIRKELDIELEKESKISSIVNRDWYSIKSDNKLVINRARLGEYKIVYSSPAGSYSGVFSLDGNKLVDKNDRSGYFEFNYNEEDTLDFTNWKYINGKSVKKEVWKFSK
jgi:hypothetical protein